jgi:hypothetical protein
VSAPSGESALFGRVAVGPVSDAAKGALSGDGGGKSAPKGGYSDAGSKLTRVAPCEAGVAPSEAGVAPSEAGVAPSGADVAPSEAGVAPSEAGVAPSDADVAPSEAGRLWLLCWLQYTC